MAINAAFFNAVRGTLYAGALNQAQVDGLSTIAEAWKQHGDGDERKLAYILATAHHETGAFKWMQEIWGPTAAQKSYEGRPDLGNTVKGDGKKFMGRGFVQLTGRRNYADWSKRLGIDLLKEPDLVTRPNVAARILVQGSMLGTFTGKKLGDYTDFADMRRVINGTDKATLIAGYAVKFIAALSGGAVVSPAPKLAPIPGQPPTEPAKAKGPPIGIILTILAFGLAAAGLFFVRF